MAVGEEIGEARCEARTTLNFKIRHENTLRNCLKRKEPMSLIFNLAKDLGVSEERLDELVKEAYAN